MTTQESLTTSPRQFALTAGISLLFMAVFAGFSYGYVFSTLIIPSDAAATIANIKASEALFRAGIFGFVVVLICDVVAAWGLYYVLKSVNKSLSVLAAWLRLVYAAVFGIAFLCLILALQVIDSSAIEQATRQAQGMVFLRGFGAMWSLSLLVFGAHLLLLGVLVLKSGFIPKIFGALVILAALCYLVNDSANLLFAQYGQYKPAIEKFISAPMAIGELALALWLVVKGGKER